MKKPYKVVHCVFYDHQSSSLGESGPILCDCFGILYKTTNLCYYIVPWLCGKNMGDETNNDCYTILKSTVKELRVMKHVK